MTYGIIGTTWEIFMAGKGVQEQFFFKLLKNFEYAQCKNM